MSKQTTYGTDCEGQLLQAFASLKRQTSFEPQIAIVLGTGLGDFGKAVDIEQEIAYADVDGLPVSTVEGHCGKFLLGKINGVKVVAMQGRVHYYEGYSSQEVVLPVRLMGMLGAKVLLVTNAAGGITFPTVGTLMQIVDHISLVPSPLIGKNIASLGKRFPDMTRPYDFEIGEILQDCARDLAIELKQGVYVQFPGPNFETASEVRFAKIIGGGAVGMSTAIEVIAARHMGMRVAGISCITNPACGIGEEELSHVDVQKAADMVGESLQKLILSWIGKLSDKKII
ncbi:MAG: purine-nucleoside phosphorylase [Clostridia bacterium]